MDKELQKIISEAQGVVNSIRAMSGDNSTIIAVNGGIVGVNKLTVTGLQALINESQKALTQRNE